MIDRRSMPVDPHHTPGPAWDVQRIDGQRYLFLGPHSRMLFTSVEAGSFEEATAVARRAWNTMDSARRDRWHGREGRYAHLTPCDECRTAKRACNAHRPRKAA